MSYHKLQNDLDDDFNNYCNCCNELLPMYKVKLNKKNCNLQLNNKMHLRFFDESTFKTINYKKIKSIELNKDNKTIIIYTSNFNDNFSFTSKKANHIFYKLKFHLNTEFNKITT